MIRIIRQLRRDLIMSDKTRKYFLYAIGEIALVVIGILIALQINNWNEYRIEREMERDLLIQLKSEYESNLEQLDEKITMRSNMTDAAMRLMAYIDDPDISNEDSIYTYIDVTLIVPTFDPIVNDIISSGRIQLIQNNELRSILTRWTSDVVQVTEEEKAWYDFRTQVYAHTLTDHISYRNLVRRNLQTASFSIFQLDRRVETYEDIGDSKLMPGVNGLLADPDFENDLAFCLYLIELTNSQSMSLRQRIVDILNLIESEIGTT